MYYILVMIRFIIETCKFEELFLETLTLLITYFLISLGIAILKIILKIDRLTDQNLYPDHLTKNYIDIIIVTCMNSCTELSFKDRWTD